RTLTTATLGSAGLCASGAPRDDLLFGQRLDVAGREPEPALEHVGRMLSQQWRRTDRWRGSVVAHRPGRHEVAIDLRVVHDLQVLALLHAAVFCQLLGVEHGPGRNAGGAQQPHRLMLIARPRPRLDQSVDLSLPLAAVLRGGKAGVVDEVVAPDDLQQAL